MNSNSIIFLDIDGVLRTHKSDTEWSIILNQPIPPKVFSRNFSRKAVSNINYITQYSNAKIVVSSTWRNNFTINELKEIFKNQGIKAEVIDKTGIGLTRGEEIQEFIDYNNIKSYVVIDDQIKDIITYIDKSKVIHVDHKIGFEDDDLVDKALDTILTN